MQIILHDLLYILHSSDQCSQNWGLTTIGLPRTQFHRFEPISWSGRDVNFHENWTYTRQLFYMLYDYFVPTQGRQDGAGYGLKVQRIVVRFPVASKDSPIIQSIKTVSGAHPPTYSNHNCALFPGAKLSGRDAGCSPSPTTYVKKQERL
jgi:hypothetical protein